MSWKPKRKDIRYVALLPDYLKEYFEGLGGFLDIFKTKPIPDTAYLLGEKFYQYKSSPESMIFKGTNDVYNLASEEPFVNIEEVKTGGKKVLKKVGEYVDEFMKVVARIGGAAVGRAIAEKVAKASQKYNIPENEIYNRALAWAVKYNDELQKIGYPSPEAAAAGVLYNKDGMPPEPNERPIQVIKRKDVIEKEKEYASATTIQLPEGIKRYWWVFAILGLLILLRR